MGRLSRGRAIVLTAVALTGAGACSPFSFDRDGAVDDVLVRSNGRLSRQQAECYVDRVADELGTDALGDDPPPEQVPRLTRIRTDCIGVGGLGTSVPRTAPPTGEARTPGPQRPGDDPALDELHRACAGGSGAACDRLFDEAPLGSEYEDFALSCGGRTAEARCADRYPG